MTYADAVVDLVRAAGEVHISIALDTPRGDEAQLCETVFGPAFAADIGRMGYPKTFDMPWIVEDLDFYGLEELSDRQVGYRSHGITGERIPDWPEDRFVIAAWAANPITVGSDGSIPYSVHDGGSWILFPHRTGYSVLPRSAAGVDSPLHSGARQHTVRRGRGRHSGRKNARRHSPRGPGVYSGSRQGHRTGLLAQRDEQARLLASSGRGQRMLWCVNQTGFDHRADKAWRTHAQARLSAASREG